jgi:hypothetical protein
MENMSSCFSPEVQVHIEHYEELQLAGQSSVVEWSDVEQVYRYEGSYITEAGISKNYCGTHSGSPEVELIFFKY